MKTGYWVLIILLAVVLIYGYNQGWFTKTKEISVITPRPLPLASEQEIASATIATQYEAGKTYIDAKTGGTIECYTRAEKSQCAASIFKSNTEPPLEGKLFSSSNTTCCYLFPPITAEYVSRSQSNFRAGILGLNTYTLQLPSNFPSHGQVILNGVLQGA